MIIDDLNRMTKEKKSISNIRFINVSKINWYFLLQFAWA